MGSGWLLVIHWKSCVPWSSYTNLKALVFFVFLNIILSSFLVISLMLLRVEYPTFHTGSQCWYYFGHRIWDIWLYIYGWLLEFSTLTTPKVISEHIMTCDSLHSWQYDSDASLGNQVANTMATDYAISHSVTLSWHWAIQPFPYPINAEHQAS